MSSPWSSTFPSTLAFGIVSCIRLRHRIRVDFPQPEGPMTAVTMRSSMSIVISWIASFSPYQAETDSTLSLIAIALSSRNGSEPDDDARYDAEPEHHDDEDQGNAPSGLVLRHVRSGGPDVNGARHERHHDGRQRENSRNRAEHEARATEPDESQLEDEGIDENPNDHGGDLGHDLDEKPDSRTEAILPEFGQIDSRQDAHRQRNKRREEDQD